MGHRGAEASPLPPIASPGGKAGSKQGKAATADESAARSKEMTAVMNHFGTTTTCHGIGHAFADESVPGAWSSRHAGWQAC